jgi:succinyl-CoA synthetase beta subunit
MKIHEYQAKELFRKNGVAVPDGASPLPSKRPRRLPKNWAHTRCGESPDPRRRPRLGGGVKVAKTRKNSTNSPTASWA